MLIMNLSNCGAVENGGDGGCPFQVQALSQWPSGRWRQLPR